MVSLNYSGGHQTKCSFSDSSLFLMALGLLELSTATETTFWEGVERYWSHKKMLIIFQLCETQGHNQIKS